VLSSCNYDCSYCPFAKRQSPPEELAKDRADLERFVDWIERRPDIAFSVFFTPWGEALIHNWYAEAIKRLSHLPQIRKVAVQTNLSCRWNWLDDCRPQRVGLWCSYHPAQVSCAEFLAQCCELNRREISYSVGVVGLREHLVEIQQLRAELNPDVYLWINAYKRQPDYYRPEDIRSLEEIDPLFRISLHRHASLGKRCRCGETVISVDGDGCIRRCHFIPEPIGNLYDSNFTEALFERACTNPTCGCHIGYVHLNELGLDDVFGEGILERVPKEPIWTRTAPAGLPEPCSRPAADS